MPTQNKTALAGAVNSKNEKSLDLSVSRPAVIPQDSSVLPIDLEQARIQLKLLGYSDDETVFLRKLKRKRMTDTRAKELGVYPQNLEATISTLPSIQDPYRGIYFVVNGGGHSKKDVAHPKAVFFEFDDRPPEDQFLVWREFGLPEPSLQIKTRHSVHTFYALDGSCDPKDWEDFQEDLNAYLGSDQTIKEPCRLMRLAGSWHLEEGLEPTRCDIFHQSEARYRFEELRSLIPARTTIETATAHHPKTHLSQMLREQILPRLSPEQAFTWSGHNWQGDKAKGKLRGCCPWHESKSGTAFYTDLKDGIWVWRCPSCGFGGTALEYRDRIQAGDGKPRGPKFVALVEELARDAGVSLPDHAPPGANQNTGEDEGDRPESKEHESVNGKAPPVANLLIDLATCAEYWVSPDRTVYADVLIRDVRQTLPIRKKPFKTWLLGSLYDTHKRVVGSETLNQVLSVLEWKAISKGDHREVALRLAKHEGLIYFDLGRSDWKTVEISPGGWGLIDSKDCPVRFIRPDTLLECPIPERGGNLEELREFLGLEGEPWVLVASWLLYAYFPLYSHPILICHGEQGAGKTSTAKFLKRLVDPGKAPLMPKIADLRDLAIQCRNRWVLAFDNLSGLSPESSDALCRIATGGGFSTRTLYADDEETVSEFLRPLILTGIDSLANRPDLLDRSLLVNLPRISEERRQTEEEREKAIAAALPRLLGAVFTALSQTLGRLPSISLERLPRMADFARFAVAAEPALGLEPGSFLKAYQGNQNEATELSLEASPVATAIRELMDGRDKWYGLAKDLFKELAGDGSKVGFPKAAHVLSRSLPRYTPALRDAGIEVVSHPKIGKGRPIEIRWIDGKGKVASQASQASPKGKNACPESVSASDANSRSSDAISSAPPEASPNGDSISQPLIEASPNPEIASQLGILSEQGFQEVNDASDAYDASKATQSRPLYEVGEYVITPSGFGVIADLLEDDRAAVHLERHNEIRPIPIRMLRKADRDKPTLPC
ncbi:MULTISPECIES: hypothetical protein [unclassified Leptolyngbya]|uniref:hypothetical protein n=1 Tax=unclassified Leptolyngbya TaxID=2650499 RepID=UPI0016848636|nr:MULTISPECIES: hypothetical protein [unclassified Leptolyngbya]MBD1913608.1 hypothetical protein [Leptolyngbya sp. FACHB-8]MBD2154061.1 hypothetical protein [Leptolyngbya sp. FACHB-16]